MGIFGAMTTAVSGLRAQAYSLENISGNIANSQTTGFKRVETSFVDLLPDMPYRRELAGSVSAFSRLTNTIQGDLQSTGVSTNMAVNGEGFFIVQERTGYQNNVPTFGGVDLYTRRGDFTLDKDGFLVNGAGLYLRGTSIDPITGDNINTGSGVVRISSEPLGARQTTEIVYRANLPTRPGTTSAVADVAGSELLAQAPSAPPPPAPAFPAGYEPRITSLPAPAGSGFVVGSDVNRFQAQSIEGGLIPAYNAVGARIDIQMRWAKVLGSAIAATDTGGNISGGIPLGGGGGNLIINGITIPLADGDTSANILTKINAQSGTTNVAASLNGSNNLVLTPSPLTGPVDIDALSTGVTLTELGLTSGTSTGVTTGGTNVSAGLTNNVGGNIVINGTTIALAEGDSSTAILNKINAATSTTGVIATMSGSNLVLTANDITRDIDIGAGSNASTLAALGLTTGTTSPVPTPGETWNLFYLENSRAANNLPAWRNVGVPFVFNTSGQMVALSGDVTVPNLTVDGNNVGNISFDFGNGGLTQYASADGRVQQSTLQQDGYSSGVLDSVSVTNDGRISGSYTNGRLVTVAAISIAQFNADNFLKRRDGGVYEQTLESGLPIIGLNGSTIIGGNVEGSNTDIAEEFSKMIVTQQAYSANTRVVSTSQQMLSDVLNMVR